MDIAAFVRDYRRSAFGSGLTLITADYDEKRSGAGATRVRKTRPRPVTPEGTAYCWTCEGPVALSEFDGIRELCRSCWEQPRSLRVVRPDSPIKPEQSLEKLLLSWREHKDESALLAAQSLAEATLVRFISRRVDSEQDADDVLAEVWFRASKAPYHPDGSAIGWLKTLAKHAIRDHYRNSSRFRDRSNQVSYDDIGETGVLRNSDADIRIELDQRLHDALPLYQLEAAQAVELLDEAIGSLPEPQSEAMKLAAANWPVREIAAKLGISEDAVESRLRRARSALSKMDLEAFLPDRDPYIEAMVSNVRTPTASNPDDLADDSDAAPFDRGYTPSTLGGQ